MVRLSPAISLLLVTLATAACGGHNGIGSLCDQVPAPAACQTACDPTPGAVNSCPLGYHCNPQGTCDLQCTSNGGQCGNGYACTADGYCMNTGSNGSGMPDANCPAVHFAPMPTTPSIELVLDRSGSMNMGDISPTRYKALQNALVGATGVIIAEQAHVYFGAALFSGDQTPCLNLSGYSVPRALNNGTAISNLIGTHNPGGSTPTADAITQVTASFASSPPPAGSPPYILLATDGQPNACDGSADTGQSVAAIKAAYTAGIKTYVIGLQLTDAAAIQFLQDVANAGMGKTTGQAPGCTGCSPYFTANDPTSLSTALTGIIGGVLSCDLTLSGAVDPTMANQGTLTLNGVTLMYGTDWVVDMNGTTIHILGNACTTLKNSSSPVVDASFPCGVVIQ